jgi:hypothetical protein
MRKHGTPGWQALLLVAEHDAPAMFAWIGVMRQAEPNAAPARRGNSVKTGSFGFFAGPNSPARGVHIRPRRQAALMSSRQPPLSNYGRTPALPE